MQRLTEPLLEHVTGLRFEALHPDTAHAARTFVLDSIAVGISGSGSEVPLAATVREVARDFGEGREARAWVTGEWLPAGSAGFLNGFRIHNQEFDCVHMPAVVHPMAVILSALTAEAERMGGVDGRRFITALAAAVDVATLLGISARDPMRFFRPAMCGALGAVAGMASLHRVDAAMLRNALGLAYSHLSGTMQAHVEGSPTLALQIALNSRAALSTWRLAQAGFPGPQEALEGPFGYLPLIEGGFDTAPALQALAAGGRQLEQVSHKVFPTGGAAHGALDMLTELRDAHGLAAGDVERIELFAPPLVRRLVARPYRADMQASYARLCLPYLAATLFHDGAVGLVAYTPEKLADPTRAAFAQRLQVLPNDCEDPNALVPQSLALTTTDGRRLQAHREAALGSPQRPLTRERQLAKFHHCLDHAARPFPQERREHIIDTIARLEALPDVRQLVDLLIPEPA